MDKRRLHHMLVGLRQLRARELMLVFGVLVLLGAFFMRQNNLHMITLRNMVLQADEQNKDIPQQLTTLRNYVASHMNTGMGEQGIYLAHSYRRAYDAAIAQATGGSGDSAVIYQNAQKTCMSQFNEDSEFLAYGQCLTDKIEASGAPAISTPSADLYRFNFVSPAWSPDVAGFTLLTAALVGLLVAGQLVLKAIIYLLLGTNR